ncbi:MAG: rod-binding protein [Verrucomicrobia bacterium]|nr:rod-binding protein [Verrucomicrobiota bacterium]MDA0723178.1 rod-binding protein [Verrucomicrobiota bacterium]MDA1047622.1 rod-binding protein [Verrucomicrobiota bacterium]
MNATPELSSSQYVGMDTSMLMEMAHSRHASEEQKAAAVSGQFESLLVKQYLKQALKPMFKGIFNENGGASGMYRHMFTDAMAESIAQGGGFGISSMLQMHLNKKVDAEGAELMKNVNESEIENESTDSSSSFTEKTDG